VGAFDSDDRTSQDVAYRLMVNSFVRLFWRSALFDQAINWLVEHGYQIVRLDAAQWRTGADMHQAFIDALGFPDYYGRNLDALNDCLRDVVAFEYGTTREATGLIFAFTGYDTFAKHCARESQVVLDIIADQARRAMLIGHRICALLQVDDPSLRFEAVGAMPVMWNDAEWLDSSRRPDPAGAGTPE
jgi:hypothetical protein